MLHQKRENSCCDHTSAAPTKYFKIKYFRLIHLTATLDIKRLEALIPIQRTHKRAVLISLSATTAIHLLCSLFKSEISKLNSIKYAHVLVRVGLIAPEMRLISHNWEREREIKTQRKHSFTSIQRQTKKDISPVSEPTCQLHFSGSSQSANSTREKISP